MYTRGSRKRWLLPLVLGLIFAVAGLVVPVISLVSAIADHRAYLAAPPCADGTSFEDTTDCRASQRSTDTSVKVGGGDDDSETVRYLFVSLPDGSSAFTALRDESDTISVREGQPVTVIAWRGEVREFVVPDGRIPAEAHPGGWTETELRPTCFLLPFGAGLLRTSHRMRRPRRQGRSLESVGRWSVSVPFVTTMLFGVLTLAPVAMAPSLLAAATSSVCAAALAVVGGAAYGARQRRRAAREAVALSERYLPEPPDEETVVPAAVLGDVPYSGEEAQYLFIGPEGLSLEPFEPFESFPPFQSREAAAPAGTGDAPQDEGEPIPVPPLSFVRLHATAPEDPRCAALERPVAVECRDGEREVLLVVPELHVPALLGALQTPVTPAAREQA
ncbi:hypothetical protein ABT026_03455 [Streptomyces sp. NPDC002734]|uniref:hypothetical protein n=1 Tax=Streptomyces sp. NPDC002734 TaxID=3154426 RepID=UPI003316DE4A